MNGGEILGYVFGGAAILLLLTHFTEPEKNRQEMFRFWKSPHGILVSGMMIYLAAMEFRDSALTTALVVIMLCGLIQDLALWIKARRLGREVLRVSITWRSKAAEILMRLAIIPVAAYLILQKPGIPPYLVLAFCMWSLVTSAGLKGARIHEKGLQFGLPYFWENVSSFRWDEKKSALVLETRTFLYGNNELRISVKPACRAQVMEAIARESGMGERREEISAPPDEGRNSEDAK